MMILSKLLKLVFSSHRKLALVSRVKDDRGATRETLLGLMGRISREDADEMIRIIDECCGRVDPNQWHC
jgi:hypothetical protein